MKNTLTNNDGGIYLNNFDPTCNFAAPTQTNDKATNNTLSNDAVNNFCPSGFAGCSGFITYQVGIDDIGDNDKVINNDISGIGYVNAANNPSAGIYILPVDTISFPTTAVKVHPNNSK